VELSEVAPPTKKHERMVKHIKKYYKKDGKLTDDEESKAYGAAWKAYNKDKVSEGASILKVRGKRNTSLVATGDHRRDDEGNIKASFYDKKPAPQGEKSGKRIARKNKSPRYGSQLHRLRPKSERGYRSEGLEEGKCDDCNCEGCGQNPCIECGENHHKLKKVTEGSEHTQWSASIMLPSKRRKFIMISCPSRDRRDAIQLIKALYGTDDIKQLNRIGIRVEGVALGKTRSTDTNTKGWKARVSSGKGMTLTKAGGLGKSKPKNMDSIVTKYKEQVKSDRRAAAKERRITEGVIDIARKYYGKKKPKKHVYPPGASGGDAGEKAADIVRDKEHKKYVNFLPANK